MRAPIRLTTLLALAWVLAWAGGRSPAQAGVSFRVATYNLENYILQPADGRTPKTAEARAAIVDAIAGLDPDVLAVQEIGGLEALQELRSALKSRGKDFPYWELATGFDTNVQVAVLSKLVMTARRSHTNEAFLLSGRRIRVSRGFAEVELRVHANYSFTLINAHLKSKRPVAIAEEAELRLEEARRLRQIVEARLQADPELNLVVLGDFNDSQDSAPIRWIVGRGKLGLIDTRPPEFGQRHNANQHQGKKERRPVAWTHYFAREDSYSRVDYILLSSGLAQEWKPGSTYVLAFPEWGLASDHRPLVATFEAPAE